MANFWQQSVPPAVEEKPPVVHRRAAAKSEGGSMFKYITKMNNEVEFITISSPPTQEELDQLAHFLASVKVGEELATLDQ